MRIGTSIQTDRDECNQRVNNNIRAYPSTRNTPPRGHTRPPADDMWNQRDLRKLVALINYHALPDTTKQLG